MALGEQVCEGEGESAHRPVVTWAQAMRTKGTRVFLYL